MQCNCQESRCMTNKVTRRIWSMFKQIQVECTYLYLMLYLVDQYKLSQNLFWKEQVNCIVYYYNLRVSRLLVGGQIQYGLDKRSRCCSIIPSSSAHHVLEHEVPDGGGVHGHGEVLRRVLVWAPGQGGRVLGTSWSPRLLETELTNLDRNILK